MHMITTALSLALLPSAHGELPLDVFPECGEQDRPDLCPPDLDEKWHLISYIPASARDSVRQEELETGSGCHADSAWRVTTGRFDVVLAVLDSGIEWDSGNLANKVYLNAGELPYPILEDGSSSDSYDADGNGLFNLQDYAWDPRVDPEAGRDEADHMLDPSDLIYTFSDGFDDDGNGYVDDIAGWDFFGGDNDPWVEYSIDFGTHGSGVAEDAAAEGGDQGDSTIGVCPNCALLPVRIGDTFVVDGDRVGEGAVFAVDSGASVLNLSVGAITHPELARAALSYAHQNGVSVSAAVGDENAYHPNYPALADDNLVVHSIRSNNYDEYGSPFSFTNFINCNNYGPRLELVTGAEACATGATAVTTGAMGLVVSAGRDAGLDLSADEVLQLLITSADDIALSEEDRREADTYPSDEGWDPFFGYGKLNVARAVERVASGDIPPVARFTSPAWFDYVDPTSMSELAVDAQVSAERAASVSWTLELGIGWNPRDWSTVASGDGPVDGTLARLDTDLLPSDLPPEEAQAGEDLLERVERVFQSSVTLRLTATDEEGRQGLARRTFFSHHDDDSLPGFPLELGGSGESSPVLADLDGDSILEIVVADSSGQVHAFHGDGTSLADYPLQTGPLPELADYAASEAYQEGSVPVDAGEGILATVAVGDLDGDSVPEVVAATTAGAIYAWSNASLLDGFPYQMLGREPDEFDDYHTYDRGFAGAPALYDLDGDGNLEIIATGMDGRLYVVDRNGGDWGPYPIEICYPETCGQVGYRSITSPALGDVDGDGDVDIGIGTNETLDDGAQAIAYILDAASGTLLDGWPVVEQSLIPEANLLPVIGEGHPSSLAFADLEGDGHLEVANMVMFGQTDLLRYDGSTAVELPYVQDEFGSGSNAEEFSMVQMLGNPAFGDMDGDGVPDLVFGGTSTMYLVSLLLVTWQDFEHLAGAWSGLTGEFLEGWPRVVEDSPFSLAPAIADVSGDGLPDAVLGSGGYLVHAWDAEGREAPGWPKLTGGWILGSPAVGDVDGDGYLDVVLTTRDGLLFAWSTMGRADQEISWAAIHHDAMNTGNALTPLPAQAGPLNDSSDSNDESSGCSCGHALPTSPFALVLLVIFSILTRRLDPVEP